MFHGRICLWMCIYFMSCIGSWWTRCYNHSKWSCLAFITTHSKWSLPPCLCIIRPFVIIPSLVRKRLIGSGMPYLDHNIPPLVIIYPQLLKSAVNNNSNEVARLKGLSQILNNVATCLFQLLLNLRNFYLYVRWSNSKKVIDMQSTTEVSHIIYTTSLS